EARGRRTGARRHRRVARRQACNLRPGAWEAGRCTGARRQRGRAAARGRRGRHPRRGRPFAGSGRRDSAVTRATVDLIGAGPADPGLITVRGLKCLAAADVVLFDHLVHPRLLKYARPDAETIDVGGAALQPLEQEAICYLLAEKAREGKTVARLKWGDPFFFDTGGAEALFLHEQGLRFEVIPGIPAGIASPACANTCAGSTRGRCSAAASWSRGRATKPPSWWIASRRWAPKPSKRR